MFQKTLQFKVNIILCYKKQNIVKISGRVPPFLTCDIFQIIVDFLSLVLSACALNQFNSHWLLFDALQSTITICLKCKELVTNPLAQVNLIDDEFWITFELSLFVTNIKREIWGVLESFLFINEYIKKKVSCNMLHLMLDPILKKTLSNIFFY
jgi:hypothetical protein